MLNKKIVGVIEHYLKLYPYIDKEIFELEQEIEYMTTINNNKDINSHIQSKNKINRTMENQVLNKITLEEKIEKYKQWKAVIETVIDIYRRSEPDKYNYLKLKYLKRYSVNRISIETTFCNSFQNRIRQDIVDYVALFAVQAKLLEI
jgi:glutamate mutase epsilon subunit